MVEIGVRLARLARPACYLDEPADPAARPATRFGSRTLARWAAAAGVALALLAPAVVRHGATTLQRPPTTLLVEGQALDDSGGGSTQRVVPSRFGAGTGHFTADPEVALHVTMIAKGWHRQWLKRATDAVITYLSTQPPYQTPAGPR